MMNCKHATRLMSEAQERKLEITERLGLGVHLALCSGCNNYHRQLQLLRQACHIHREQFNPAQPDTSEVQPGQKLE